MEKYFKHENGNVIVITDKNHESLMNRYGYEEMTKAEIKAYKKEDKKEDKKEGKE